MHAVASNELQAQRLALDLCHQLGGAWYAYRECGRCWVADPGSVPEGVDFIGHAQYLDPADKLPTFIEE